MNELGIVNELLAANNVTGYAAERANLLTANTALFNYLTPIAQRASAALPNLLDAAATDAAALAPEYDVAATDVGLLYTALELWAVVRDSDSQALASSFAADVIADLDSAGPQAALVQGELTGVTVPGQVVISSEGGTAARMRVGALVSVNYFITNVGDQPLAPGSVRLMPGTNVTLMTPAKLTLPALSAGGFFMANWQFRVTGTGAIDFGYYQINATVTGIQTASVDDVFVITGGE